jgi:tRNA (cmo5U34)-methyltransferase
MLTKAASRVEANSGRVEGVHQQDIRSLDLPNNQFDIVVAAAVLHHLRTKEEWTKVLKNVHQSLKPGGTLWIWDLIKYDNAEIEKVQNERYGRYLTALKDEAYKNQVFDYIEKEDSPESSAFILQKMYGAGFNEVDVIHKNVKFCAIYGRK